MEIEMKKRILLEAIVIFLMQVLNIQAGCSWDSSLQMDCSISCKCAAFECTGTIDLVFKSLDERWKERENCHTDGIDLTLKNDIAYPNFMLEANWFTAQVKVKELNIGLSNVYQIRPNAFNSNAFKSVKKLVIPNMFLASLNKQMFNGLESLEILVVQEATIANMPQGLIDLTNETLKEFSLIQSSRSVNEIFIDEFTGSATMKSLEYVKVNYKLKDTLTRKSFVGLLIVNTLDLSDCQITSIGQGTFDPISSSMRVLNLTNNFITTLPEGLFDLMLPNEVLTVLLKDNSWDCECHLMPLKIYLVENCNFEGHFECSTPTEWNGLDIIDTNFCDIYVSPSPTTTPTITTTATPSINETTTTDPSIPEEFDQECYEAGETELSLVYIKTPKYCLMVNENGDVTLVGATLNENSILIWFSSVDQETFYTASDEVTCVIYTDTTPISNLREGVTYTFCAMDSTEKTVSPLDCISYTKRHAVEQLWLLQNSKKLFVSLVAVACVISVFSGLIIKMFVVKKIERRKERKNQENNSGICNVLTEAYKSENNSTRKNSTSSSAPPLPLRPYVKNSFGEPIYTDIN